MEEGAGVAEGGPEERQPYRVVGLAYVSLYVQDLPEAVAFYSRVFGPPGSVEEGDNYGWRMGDTWLTLFPAKGGPHGDGNPRNAEFAVRVASPGEVDALHSALLEAGAAECMPPRDTRMYEPMRFSCVDDPFGARIDVYCPLESA